MYFERCVLDMWVREKDLVKKGLRHVSVVDKLPHLVREKDLLRRD